MEFVRKTFLGWNVLEEALLLLKVWCLISYLVISISALQEHANEIALPLQVWARQRGSVYAHDCLNGYLIAVILSYLVSRSRINKSMTAVQIFRTTLAFIGIVSSSYLYDKEVIYLYSLCFEV